MEELFKQLEGVELNEEQVKVFDRFIEEFAEKVKDETSEVYVEELKKLKKDVKSLTESAKEIETKFNPENVEKAFEIHKEEIEKEYQEQIDELKDDMANKLAETMQSVYSDVEVRAKQDLSESREMKTLEKMKDLIAPLIVKDESLVKENNSLLEELDSLRKERDELSKEKVITTLLEGIPEEFVDYVRNFISKGDTEEAIYERYEEYLPIIEMKIKSASGNTTVEVDEDEVTTDANTKDAVIPEEDIEDAIEENIVFSSDSRTVVTEEKEEDKKNKDGRMSEEDALKLIYANYVTPHGLR